MPSLNAEAASELATDLAAAAWLRRLHPDEVPHPLEVHDRLRALPRHATPRQRAFLEGFYEVAKLAAEDRYKRDAAEAAAWRERVFGGGGDERGAP